jgi:hypothetical protein
LLDAKSRDDAEASREARVVSAIADCAAMKLRVGQMEFGIALLVAEVERFDPNSHVIRYVRDILGALYPISRTPLPSDLSNLANKII